MLRLQTSRKRLLSVKDSSTSGQPVWQAGFTLIEILVAITILAIGLMGIASMMAASARGGAFGRRTTVAENLAIQKLEQFRNLVYADVKKLAENPNNAGAVKHANQCACPGGFTCVANLSSCTLQKDPTCIQSLQANELISTEFEDYGTVPGDPEPGGQSFKRVTVVRALDGCAVPPADGLASVTVTVSWKGSQPTGQIQEHVVQLGTYIAK